MRNGLLIQKFYSSLEGRIKQDVGCSFPDSWSTGSVSIILCFIAAEDCVMWQLIGKESVAMSTCYPTRVGYNLCKSYIDINIGLYIRQLARPIGCLAVEQ